MCMCVCVCMFVRQRINGLDQEIVPLMCWLKLMECIAELIQANRPVSRADILLRLDRFQRGQVIQTENQI